ncbi:MAG: DUF1566 domain-containing protein [Deltaproteobacteria bacterium]|nr:DUF1566 domain-containing protein [Deltaproteobacteria bacterium]
MTAYGNVTSSLVVALLLGLFACGDTDEKDTGESDSGDSFDCPKSMYDESNGLCWQHPRATGLYTRQAAMDYCSGLNLAGQTDWRLPSRDDFIELLGGCDNDVTSGDWGYCNSCEKSETCNALFGSEENLYWSSTLENKNKAWTAYLGSGRLSRIFVRSYVNVRCVCSKVWEYNGQNPPPDI